MSTRLAVFFAVCFTVAVMLIYAMLGGFTGLYEDIFNCPRDSKCQTVHSGRSEQ